VEIFAAKWWSVNDLDIFWNVVSQLTSFKTPFEQLYLTRDRWTPCEKGNSKKKNQRQC